MLSKDTIKIAPGFKAALLSGAMGLALIGCDAVRDDRTPVAAPAPAAGPATVGTGTGTGAPQSDVGTAATGEVGSVPGVEAEGARSVGEDGAVTPHGSASDEVDAEGARTVGAGGQVTPPGGASDSVDAEGSADGGEMGGSTGGAGSGS